MLRSDLRDYSDAYFVVKGAVDILVADKAEIDILFKNNPPFRSFIQKLTTHQ